MNGFVRQQVAIGSQQQVHQHKMCSKCESIRPPEGGIHMSSAKWICAMCWTKRTTVNKLLQHATAKTTKPSNRQTNSYD
jgi:hypothetical protein